MEPVGLDRSESVFHYFVGPQEDWHGEVSSYGAVAYEDLYDGIDLHTWGLRSSLKYEFQVAPGADYTQIAVQYDGIAGLAVDEDGALVVDLGGEWGQWVDDAPYIYQTIDGQQVEVAGRFELLDDRTYAFEITGDYEDDVSLIIDPDLVWSTYLGGTERDDAAGITLDPDGNILVVGQTWSNWVSGGYDSTYGGRRDAYVAKLSPDGAHLWSTYLGGSSWDQGYDIAADTFSNVVVTGLTTSSGWVSGGYDTSLGGSGDAFVVRLSADGAHLWSTYVGGTLDDIGEGITLDTDGNVFVTGITFSPDWVSGGADTTRDGPIDAFVAKLSPTGNHVWSTYLGGGDGVVEGGCAIAVDANGNVAVTGYTNSSGWVSGGYDTSYNGGDFDAFVAKLSAAGDHIWSTFLGGARETTGRESQWTEKTTSWLSAQRDPLDGSPAGSTPHSLLKRTRSS